MPSNLATSQQQRGMPNFMPPVHQARRTIRNRQEGNPFATDDSIQREIEQLTAGRPTSPPATIGSPVSSRPSWTCSKP
jgi:hypothetical protein